MVALGAVIMSLACVFLGYCGLQFRAELKRSRARLTSHGLVRMWPVEASAMEIPNRGIAVQMPQPPLRVEPLISTTDLAFRRLASSPRVISTYRKGQIAVLPSGTGLLAVRKVAKG